MLRLQIDSGKRIIDHPDTPGILVLLMKPLVEKEYFKEKINGTAAQ